MGVLKKIYQKEIDLIVYDFDGVMTDDRVLVSEDGTESVYCHRADGMAVSEIKKLNIPQIILSTETNKVVNVRAKKLNIEAIHGVDDKESILRDYCKQNEYSLERVVFIGNGMNDLQAMKVVGYPVAPANASDEVKNISKFITKKQGGEGVVMEFFKDILSIQKGSENVSLYNC